MGEFMKANGIGKGLPVTMTAGGPKLNGKDIKNVSLGKGAAYNKVGPGRPPRPRRDLRLLRPSSSRRSGRACRPS